MLDTYRPQLIMAVLLGSATKYRLHFTDEEAKAQQNEASCPKAT